MLYYLILFTDGSRLHRPTILLDKKQEPVVEPGVGQHQHFFFPHLVQHSHFVDKLLHINIGYSFRCNAVVNGLTLNFATTFLCAAVSYPHPAGERHHIVFIRTVTLGSHLVRESQVVEDDCCGTHCSPSCHGDGVS